MVERCGVQRPQRERMAAVSVYAVTVTTPTKGLVERSLASGRPASRDRGSPDEGVRRRESSGGQAVKAWPAFSHTPVRLLTCCSARTAAG